MSIIGFTYTGISAEKTKDIDKKVGIRNNISIKDISEHKIPFTSTDDKSFKVSFEFLTEYSPDFGNIKIDSELFIVRPKKEANEILDEWKKNKKLRQDLVPSYFNFILRKCNLKAMILAEDLNLPSPYPLPKATPAETKK